MILRIQYTSEVFKTSEVSAYILILIMQAGHFYHIYNRGINKGLLFFEDMNYDYFLTQFNKYLIDHVDVFSYCLMPNHFHFLVRIKDDGDIREAKTSEVLKTSEVYPKLTPIEKAFKDFFISYSKAVNKKYQRTGSLFQAKFKKRLINADGYLIRLIAYIHLNPIRAGLCNKPEEWLYSSYSLILNSTNPMLKSNKVIELFGNKEEFVEFHKNYRDFQRERDLLFKSEEINKLPKF